MSTSQSIKVGPLKQSELEEAHRIVRLAFGTFLGLPNPLDFMGDRNFIAPRWHSPNVKVIAARDDGRLIGSNVVTRWGSFGFFGPLTVLPEYWDRGVAQRLLEATMQIFDRWGVRHTGLFTFPHSAKHVGLYQKFGYWPRYLTAIMTLTPESKQAPQAAVDHAPALLSAAKKGQREAVHRGMPETYPQDRQRPRSHWRNQGCAGPAHRRRCVDLYARCSRCFRSVPERTGSEGGEKTCYVKFGAARHGAGAGERFDKLLQACEAFAASRGATVEAGVNLAREDAYRRMRARGYRAAMQGVAMHRPHAEGFNRADAYVIDDWR